MCVDTELIATYFNTEAVENKTQGLNGEQSVALPAYLCTFLSQIRQHTAENMHIQYVS